MVVQACLDKKTKPYLQFFFLKYIDFVYWGSEETGSPGCGAALSSDWKSTLLCLGAWDEDAKSQRQRQEG
jgi:hypothetical protein